MNVSSPNAKFGGTTSGGAVLGGTTPVPNVLFDTYLSRLSDTELRVLLVVNRATLGWKEGTGRKASDWLSHRQLQARTGRAGASVSHAIQSLVSRGLLIVQDAAGRTCDSAHSRRATRGRLYYRLSDALLAPKQVLDQAHLPGEGAKLPSAAINLIERGNADESKEDITPISTSLGRLQKVKTTKETGTKEKEEKMSSLESEVSSPQNAPQEKEATTADNADDLDEQVERFLSVFIAAYQLARPQDDVPPVEAADRTLLRRYLKHPGFGVLETWLPAFFASSFGYVRRRRWSVGCYLNCLFILQAQSGPMTGARGRWQCALQEKSRPKLPF